MKPSVNIFLPPIFWQAIQPLSNNALRFASEKPMTHRLCFAFRSSFAIVLFVFFAAISAPACGETPREWATANVSDLFQLYQFFHTHPELSFQEKETAARVAKELKAVGVEVTEGAGGTGVVGVLKNGKGPTVMLRTDLDALPV